MNHLQYEVRKLMGKRFIYRQNKNKCKNPNRKKRWGNQMKKITRRINNSTWGSIKKNIK